ncbi:MAG: post-PEP-CTERM-1 domain-containing protein [Pyrinomonadaceae bacterium]
MKDSQRPQFSRQKTKRLVRIAAILAAIIAVAGITTVVLSQDKGSARKKTPQTAPATGKHYVATKEIIFDQASSTLRKPTTEETAELVAQISSLTNRSTDGLTAKELPNGTKQINLQGRFGGVVLGRARADGSTEIRCVTSMQEAVDFLGLEESTSPNQ